MSWSPLSGDTPIFLQRVGYVIVYLGMGYLLGRLEFLGDRPEDILQGIVELLLGGVVLG